MVVVAKICAVGPNGRPADGQCGNSASKQHMDDRISSQHLGGGTYKDGRNPCDKVDFSRG